MNNRLAALTLNFVFLSCTLLAQIDDIKFAQVEIPELQTQPSVSTVFRDSKGFMWIATDLDGVYRFDGYDYKQYTSRSGDSTRISDNSAFAIVEDKDNTLWFATFFGLCKFDRKLDTFKPYFIDGNDKTSYSNNFFVQAQFDKDHNLILKEAKKGLHVLQSQSNLIKPFETRKESNISLKDVLVFLVDSRGWVWFNTYIENKSVLYAYEPKASKIIVYEPNSANSQSIPSSCISKLFEDSKGNVWLATPEGLTKLDVITGKATRYNKKIVVVPYGSLSIEEDDSGKMWIASSGGGLHILDPKTGEFNPDYAIGFSNA